MQYVILLGSNTPKMIIVPVHLQSEKVKKNLLVQTQSQFVFEAENDEEAKTKGESIIKKLLEGN
jgi:hypothetical protein